MTLIDVVALGLLVVVRLLLPFLMRRWLPRAVARTPGRLSRAGHERWRRAAERRWRNGVGVTVYVAALLTAFLYFGSALHHRPFVASACGLAVGVATAAAWDRRLRRLSSAPDGDSTDSIRRASR
jgi:hypothetical protein